MKRFLKTVGLVLAGGAFFLAVLVYQERKRRAEERRRRLAELDAAERDADGGCLPECADCRGNCPRCGRKPFEPHRETFGDGY